MASLHAPSSIPYQTRPAREDDLEAMFQCFRLTMRLHIEPAYGWDEAFQRSSFLNKALGADCTVFDVGQDFAGFGWVERGESDWLLRMVCVHPDFQNRGIGRDWVGSLRDEAVGSGQRLRLKVFKTNRARALYERLGFQRGDDFPYIHELFFDGR